MSIGTESKNYCVVFQLGKASGIGRVRMVVPGIIALVNKWSNRDAEQIFRSNDGQLFGYFFNSAKPMAVMRADFETSTATDNQDSMFIFEANSNLAKVGFSQPASWLSRH